MIKATRDDKSLIVNILIDSFKDNQSVNYIVRQDNHKLKCIRALMEYSFEICFNFGETWLSDDGKACALLLFPQKKRTTIQSIWRDIKLIWQAIGIGGVMKALDRETKIKAKQPKEPMLYLWFIGVDPTLQHRGIGTQLLKEIINRSNERNLPIFLETSTIKNLPWYENFNFYTYDKLELGYTLFFLKHEPDKS